MFKLRDCPICGNPVDIRVILREYGFNGIIIECPNCHCALKDGKCSEQIRDDDFFATPITERSLSECLFRTIRLWNTRSKRANEQDVGAEMCKNAEEWKERRSHENT